MDNLKGIKPFKKPVKEHVVIQGERITIYDKDWKIKEHGKIMN